MAAWFLRISVLYVAFGVIFGWIIGISDKLVFANVHAHINLLGFATLALAGLIYRLYPSADNKLAVAQFWLQNVGLPIFMIGLFTIDAGNTARGFLPTSVGATLCVLAIVVFALNVWINVPGRTVRTVSATRSEIAVEA
jgi:cbb3-type cytochrome oxidase subunit 1